MKRDCRQPDKKESAGAALQDDETKSNNPKYDRLCDTCVNKQFTKTSQIMVEGQVVTAFRDTGSTSTIVDSKLVPSEKVASVTKETTFAKSTKKEVLHTAKVQMDTPYFEGETEVSVMDNPVYPVLIGNKIGVGKDRCETPVYPVRDPEIKEVTASVTTRGQQKAEEKREKTLPPFPNQRQIFTVADLKREQQQDKTLERLHVLARTNLTQGRVKFVHDKDILYRQYMDKAGKSHRQVVVPTKMRGKVLSTRHDSPMAGHLGQKKTRERIWQDFFWPGIVGDIKRYCISCDMCQRTTPKGRTPTCTYGTDACDRHRVQRVAVDIIGPIKPKCLKARCSTCWLWSISRLVTLKPSR